MSHQGSSLFATLGAALNAISHPHFPLRSSSMTAHPHPEPPPHPALSSFNTDLVARLHELKQPNAGSYLCVAWLHQAMATVLATNSAAENLLPVLHHSLSSRDSKWVDEYLDDSAKLLDVCNFLKEGLADVDLYQQQVELALHAFEAKDGLSEIKCNRAKHALIDCMEAKGRKDQDPLQRHRSKLETCSSMLRRMGEKLAPVAHDSQSNPFLSALYAAKLTTIFICSLLAAALGFKPRRQFPLPNIIGHFPWSSSLLILQHKAKDEIDRGRTRQSVVQLQELDNVDAAIIKLHDFVEHALLGKLLPLGREEPDELKNLVENLHRSSKELEMGLGPLKQQVNELFRMLVTSRVALLDLLSHAKD